MSKEPTEKQLAPEKHQGIDGLDCGCAKCISHAPQSIEAPVTKGRRDCECGEWTPDTLVNHSKDSPCTLLPVAEPVPSREDERMEELSAEIHTLYCKQYEKDNGKPYWTNGDYTLLDERTKEYDRNIARWYLSRVPADNEDEGWKKQVRGSMTTAWLNPNRTDRLNEGIETLTDFIGELLAQAEKKGEEKERQRVKNALQPIVFEYPPLASRLIEITHPKT